MHIKYTWHLHPLTMFQVQVRHERWRTGLPRETTYVITARDDVCDHRERRRTWSPQETTYVIASRNNVHYRLKRWRTWLPWETTYVTALRNNVRDRLKRRRTWLPQKPTNVIVIIKVFTVSSSTSRCCDQKWLITNLKSLVKASYRTRCSDTPKYP